jgi:hypothetical protein
MRGRAFRRFGAAGALALVVSATGATVALGNETMHVKIAAPKTSARERTITLTGATTSQFRHLRGYRERVATGASCAVSFESRPNHALQFGWNDLVPHNASGLVSFERKEKVLAGNTGQRWLVCAYLVNDAGHPGARAQFSYQDVATH